MTSVSPALTTHGLYHYVSSPEHQSGCLIGEYPTITKARQALRLAVLNVRKLGIDVAKNAEALDMFEYQSTNGPATYSLFIA